MVILLYDEFLLFQSKTPLSPIGDKGVDPLRYHSCSAQICGTRVRSNGRSRRGLLCSAPMLRGDPSPILPDRLSPQRRLSGQFGRGTRPLHSICVCYCSRFSPQCQGNGGKKRPAEGVSRAFLTVFIPRPCNPCRISAPRRCGGWAWCPRPPRPPPGACPARGRER